jgi:hypothetical protein
VTDPTSPDPVDAPHVEAPAAELPEVEVQEVDAPEVGSGSIARHHPVVVYSLLRIAMLVAVGAVLYLLQARGVWLILFAFLISGVLSAFLLKSPREGAVLGFRSAYKGINARIDDSTRAEDAAADLDDDLDEDGSTKPSA